MLLLAIGAFAFAAGAVPLLIIGWSHGPAQFAGWLAFALIDVAFFGMAFWFAVSRLFANTPALRIDGRGIEDRSALISPGFIAWDEVASWHVAQMGFQRMLCLVPIDTEAFLARQSPFKRFALARNVGLVGSPFVISTISLPISLKALAESVDAHMQAAHPYGVRTVIPPS
jgi:hypothetical protein